MAAVGEIAAHATLQESIPVRTPMAIHAVITAPVTSIQATSDFMASMAGDSMAGADSFTEYDEVASR